MRLQEEYSASTAQLLLVTIQVARLFERLHRLHEQVLLASLGYGKETTKPNPLTQISDQQ